MKVVARHLWGIVPASLVVWGMFTWWGFWMEQFRQEGGLMLVLRWGFTIASIAVVAGLAPAVYFIGWGLAAVAFDAREERKS